MHFKVVIPLSSRGLSLLPASKSVPAELFPLGDVPVIQHIVNEVAAAGLRDIVFITHADKYAVPNHFDLAYELESLLEQKKKMLLLEQIRSITPPGVNIACLNVHGYNGDGHATLQAKPVIGQSAFVLILPRFLHVSDEEPLASGLQHMLERFTRTGRNQILVRPLLHENESHMREVVCTETALTKGGDVACIGSGKQDIHLTHYSVCTGRFVVTPGLWPVLEHMFADPQDGGTLMDAVRQLVLSEGGDAVLSTDEYYDCAEKAGYMKAFVEFSLRHAVEGEKLRKMIKNRMLSHE